MAAIRKFIKLVLGPITLLQFVNLGSTATIIPSEVRIGGFFPMFLPGSSTVDKNGIQYLAAFLMALREINNKHDGYYDDLLPRTKIVASIRISKGNDTHPDFIDDVYDAIYVAAKAFNGTGVQANIATASNSASNNVAQIFNGFKLVQVAYGSTGSFLSYSTPFPYYYRTCSDDAFQGYALAEIISMHFHWKSVSVFSSIDSYGSDLFQQFSIRANQVGINIVSIHQFRAGLLDFTPLIQNCLTHGTRIFVLFMAGSDAGPLLEQGYKLGLFGRQGTQIIGSNQIVSPKAWNAMSETAPVQSILNGAMAVSQSFTYDTSTLKDFARRWVHQNDTVTVDPITGIETCHTGVDDDGSTYLYQGQVKEAGQTVMKCAGLQFKKQFGSDGSGIADYAPFAYDAVVALAQGLHNTIYEQGYSKFDGDILNNALSFNYSASGVTGEIAFRQGDSTG